MHYEAHHIFKTNGNPVKTSHLGKFCWVTIGKNSYFDRFSETTSCIRIHDIVGKEYEAAKSDAFL